MGMVLPKPSGRLQAPDAGCSTTSTPGQAKNLSPKGDWQRNLTVLIPAATIHMPLPVQVGQEVLDVALSGLCFFSSLLLWQWQIGSSSCWELNVHEQQSRGCWTEKRFGSQSERDRRVVDTEGSEENP